MPQNPGKEWRQKWSTLDPAKANQMLDALGLAKKDRDGYRLRTDNGERLRLQVQTVVVEPDGRQRRWSPQRILS